jgi:hypothetical protein
MKRKHQKTLDLIFKRPVSGNIQWKDIESLFLGLGAEISEGTLEKPTPPSAFVGRIGYPKVFAGPLVTMAGDKPEYYDSPWLWKWSIEDVMRLRMSLVRGMRIVDVHSAANPDRYVMDVQDATASVKPVDVEAEIAKVVKRPVFDDVMQPMGIAARLESMKLAENPKIPERVEKIYSGDAKAVDATKYLVDQGFSTYYLQKIFSVGMP